MLKKLSTFLVAMLLSVPWAAGQSTFGGIVGVVKDPSQGAVAGAQVTLISLDDHSQRNATLPSSFHRVAGHLSRV